jgi:S-adenosylmethionine-diacylgycerolhomoserine-N-methlytransferase
MNEIYRYQRHFYDFTRVAFLFGRDRLLGRMELGDGARVLEVGCGTARNLVKLSAKNPTLELYGLDASTEMLETAQANVARRRLDGRVTLGHGLAQELSPLRDFGVPAFDAVFFSYSLSMIPACTRSVDAALASLKANGSIYIVDFCDLGGLPPLLRHSLTAWLRLFGVEHRPELHEHLAALARDGAGELESQPFLGRYGIWSRFRKK